MSRTWHKTAPPKFIQEHLNIYKGIWMPQLDRSWESEDGYGVMSRRIRTAWGPVEHVTIERINGGGDIPWAVKQEIKDELFGFKSTAIEVFPAKKNLVDVCDVYHLWVLPPDFKLPFGIHTIREPHGEPIERGYDFNLEDCQKWIDSDTRKALIAEKKMVLTDTQKEHISQMLGMLEDSDE